MNVGFIGIGNMGFGMAANILKAGFNVTAFDLSKGALDRFEEIGGNVCSNNAELGEMSDVVFVMTMSGPQADSAMYGENGLCEKIKKGAVVIVTASCGEPWIKKIEEKIPEDVFLLDCPVTGGQTRANSGELTLMLSGDKNAYEKAEPVLKACSEKIYYCGKNPGDGQNAKSCNQLMTGIEYIAAAEALSLAMKAGLDAEIVANIIGDGVAGSQMFRQVANYAMDRDFMGGGANMMTMHKDMDLVMEVARNYDCPLNLSALTAEYFRSGWVKYKDECTWAVAKVVEDMCGTVIDRNANKK